MKQAVAKSKMHRERRALRTMNLDPSSLLHDPQRFAIVRQLRVMRSAHFISWATKSKKPFMRNPPALSANSIVIALSLNLFTEAQTMIRPHTKIHKKNAKSKNGKTISVPQENRQGSIQKKYLIYQLFLLPHWNSKVFFSKLSIWWRHLWKLK